MASIVRPFWKTQTNKQHLCFAIQGYNGGQRETKCISVLVSHQPFIDVRGFFVRWERLLSPVSVVNVCFSFPRMPV